MWTLQRLRELLAHAHASSFIPIRSVLEPAELSRWGRADLGLCTLPPKERGPWTPRSQTRRACALPPPRGVSSDWWFLRPWSSGSAAPAGSRAGAPGVSQRRTAAGSQARGLREALSRRTRRPAYGVGACHRCGGLAASASSPSPCVSGLTDGWTEGRTPAVGHPQCAHQGAWA